MLDVRKLERCRRAFYGAADAGSDDDDDDENDYSGGGSGGGDDRIVTFYVVSYGIGRVWNVLRHVYLVYRGVEIHPGMTNEEEGDDGEKQLVLATLDYYGPGRVEGRVLCCVNCANRLLLGTSEKSRRFHLAYNNCDTIVPAIMQTALLWLSVIGLIVGAIVLTLRRDVAFDAFSVALFAPTIAGAFTLAYNRFDSADRRDFVLSRCPHVARHALVSTVRSWPVARHPNDA